MKCLSDVLAKCVLETVSIRGIQRRERLLQSRMMREDFREKVNLHVELRDGGIWIGELSRQRGDGIPGEKDGMNKSTDAKNVQKVCLGDPKERNLTGVGGPWELCFSSRPST